MTRAERQKRRRIRQRRRQAIFLAALLLVLAAFVAARVSYESSEDKLSEITEGYETIPLASELPGTSLAGAGVDKPPEHDAADAPAEVAPISLGTYRITAYCSCEICCGEWAKNRPNGIVYGASGAELFAGVSCASPLPFGTCVMIDSIGEYIVQDRLANWVIEKYGENQIDIYFADHQAALEFGVKYLEVYKLPE